MEYIVEKQLVSRIHTKLYRVKQAKTKKIGDTVFSFLKGNKAHGHVDILQTSKDAK